VSIEGLEKISELYSNEGGVFEENNRVNIIDYFMKTTIDTFKDQSDEIANLRQELAKKMEGNEMVIKKQLTENKHQALLNNCVDSDEAILHKREIEGVIK